MYDDFVDLRGSNLSSDSFWPSFTDIMMVIVMIFLLTSTILMVKNWELIEQLRTSMLAEQQASEIIKYTSQENATLEEQLTNAQYEISILRVQYMQASEQTIALRESLTGKEKQIIILISENQKIENYLIGSNKQISDLSGQIEQLQTVTGIMRTQVSQQSLELKKSRDKIIILSTEKELQATTLSNLGNTYDALKVKYNKLIKPARTAKGKYVVEVHYQRIDNIERIRFKSGKNTAYKTVSSTELHALLADVKKAHPKTLYIKIIIPKESGLSYSEAWTFMKRLLERYDYYHQ